MFVPLLLLVGTEALPPVKLECRRDNAGICLRPELTPLSKIHPVDIAQASSIYQSYWACYWNSISGHRNFGTYDPQFAMKIYAFAAEKCSDARASAEVRMDEFLSSRKVYGAAEHMRFARDYFRQSAGKTFLDQAASRDGKSAPYARTSSAYEQFEHRRS